MHAYTSNSRIPLQYVPVTITDHDGAAIAMRLTNRSGKFDDLVAISVPDKSESQAPGSGAVPFSTVNLYAKAENYEQITAENIQVFADTVTDQNLELIPLSEYPAIWNKEEIFSTPAQNL